jgi:hypothetical protein
MRIAQARHGLDRAELCALRAARRAKVSAELREALRRQRLERRELAGHDPDERIDALDRCRRRERLPIMHRIDQRIELVEDDLEPQLARLVDDDEQQLVRVLRARAWPLQPEQLIEREVGPVVHVVGALLRRVARHRQKVATSSVMMSSTRMVSTVK